MIDIRDVIGGVCEICENTYDWDHLESVQGVDNHGTIRVFFHCRDPECMRLTELRAVEWLRVNC